MILESRIENARVNHDTKLNRPIPIIMTDDIRLKVKILPQRQKKY